MMLMAAGEGTRLRPFTQISPKPLLPVMGVPCVQFVVDQFSSQGVLDFVVNLHHLPVLMKKGLEELDWSGARYRISDESQTLLGSAGGIRNALNLLGDGPFFLANADRLIQIDLKKLGEQHQRLRRERGVLATLAVFQDPKSKTAYREFEIDPQTQLVEKMGDLRVGTPFYVGVACFEPQAFSGLPENTPSDFVKDLMPTLIREKKLGAYSAEVDWLDVDSPALWLDAHLQLIQKLEKNECPAIWKKRILETSIQKMPGIWVSKGALKAQMVQASSPGYFASQSNWKGQFGPNAVLYDGIEPTMAVLENGIGYGGIWQKI